VLHKDNNSELKINSNNNNNNINMGERGEAEKKTE